MIETVWAQESVTPGRRKFIDWPILKFGLEEIPLPHDIGLLGFKFLPQKWVPPENCKEGNQFHHKMMTLLRKKEEKEQKIKDDTLDRYIKRCLLSFDSLFVSQLEALEKGLDKKIKESGSLPLPRWISLFQESLSLQEKLRERKKILFRGREILEEISFLKSSFWRSWIELALALNTPENFAWPKRPISRTIKTGPYENFFYAPWGGRENREEEVAKLLVFALKKFKRVSRNKILPKILADKLNQLQANIEFKALKIFFRANWSLAKLRSLSPRGLITRTYFDFWYSKYFNRTSEGEMSAFLQQVLNVRVLKRASLAQFWVFEHYFPEKDTLKKIIFKRLEMAWKSKDLYKKFIVIKLLAREEIKKELEKKIPELKGPYTAIQKQYFRILLDSQAASQFALYHLMHLEDTNPEYLWEIVGGKKEK